LKIYGKMIAVSCLALSTKEVHNLEERVCPLWTFCRKRRGLQMWMSVLFGTENLDFSKFMVCPHQKRNQDFAKGGAWQWILLHIYWKRSKTFPQQNYCNVSTTNYFKQTLTSKNKQIFL